MLRIASIFILLASLFVMPINATAEQVELDDAKKDIITQNCVTSQVNLQRIQYNDTATRVNRGQAYEALLSQLMTPLNSRTANNGLSGEAAQLTQITNSYQQALRNFKKHYEQYDDAIKGAIKIRCQNKPQEFYNYLKEAQRLRASISQDVAFLDQKIEEYRKIVDDLKNKIEQ